MMDGRSTSPRASSNTRPCICPVTPMPAMSPLVAPAFVMHSRIAEQATRHQSSGSCSAQPTLGDDIGACSAVAALSTRPVSSSSTARVPLVPTSIPRSLAVIVLAFTGKTLIREIVFFTAQELKHPVRAQGKSFGNGFIIKVSAMSAGNPQLVPTGLEWAHPLVRDWFVSRFGTPTEPQEQGWPHILAGKTTLISAPTGSGKTLAAFLICIDSLVRKAVSGELTDNTQALYVSPLKALSNDIQKNLEIPLGEILQLAGQRGILMPEVRTAVRTGDTLAHERRAMLARPPHILVTTPESLYILLTAARSREVLTTVESVIVDEIHAVADDKRGSHLALSLERLDHLAGKRLTRIGLSATQKPIELLAHFLTSANRPDPIIVQIGHRRELDLAIEVPGSELGPVASNEMWDEIYDRLAALATQHRSTLIFVNTRRLAERMAHHLGQRLGKDAVAAHHGSLSRKLRLVAERKLKAGEIRALVATASLELGIDIGSIDLVCQIGSPRSISVG